MSMFGLPKKNKETDKVTYLARGPHCWGRGDTQEEAIEAAETQRFISPDSEGNVKYHVYMSDDPEVFVDGYGTATASGSLERLPDVIIRKGVDKRKKKI